MKTEVTKVCSICGKEFKTTNSRRKYCSIECSKIGRKERKKNYDRKRRKLYKKSRPEVIKICPECGREFKTSDNRRNFCDDCSIKTWGKKRSDGLKECIKKHDNCFSCPTKDGECLF